MSKYVEWSNELSVGVDEIDEQHKMLVELLNQMHEAVRERQAAQITNNILERLGEYTRVHFAVEESLMHITHCPDYAWHKVEHDQLIGQLQELREKLADGKHSISFELVHFLKVWLTKHIMESDKRYSSHFLAYGINPELVPHNASWIRRCWRFLRGG